MRTFFKLPEPDLATALFQQLAHRLMPGSRLLALRQRSQSSLPDLGALIGMQHDLLFRRQPPPRRTVGLSELLRGKVFRAICCPFYRNLPPDSDELDDSPVQSP